MSEAKFKKVIHRGFLDFAKHFELPLHWQLHEDALSVGIPDISYGVRGANGWIEAKWDNQMPKVGSKYIPHFELFQEAWLVARGKAGGPTHLVHGYSDGVVIMSHEGLLRRRPEMNMMDIADLKGVFILPKFDMEAVRIILRGDT